jgi:BirA family biotin operon repressor/biotin-[acetyl-CoA-carboxylase] ligase
MAEEDTSPASITGKLDTRFIGQKVIYFPQLSSTMDVARSEARQGGSEGTIIIAGEQTGGRGRVKRHWLSPPGNIALSVILHPDVSNLPYLIMIASLAVVRSIESVTGLKADIKWPNDVLIDGKKVCGILIENEISGDRTASAIIGIGVNVNLGELKIQGSSIPVTSLEKEVRETVVKTDLINNLLVEMERLYLCLPNGREIFEDWQDKLVTLGKRVVVQTGSETLEGLAESVDSGGAPMLKLDNGSSTRIVAGDVSLREK